MALLKDDPIWQERMLVSELLDAMEMDASVGQGMSMETKVAMYDLTQFYCDNPGQLYRQLQGADIDPRYLRRAVEMLDEAADQVDQEDQEIPFPKVEVNSPEKVHAEGYLVPPEAKSDEDRGYDLTFELECKMDGDPGKTIQVDRFPQDSDPPSAPGDEPRMPSKALMRAINRMCKRENVGIKKYGTTVDRNDLTTEDWLTHAQEEAMDLVLYLERLVMDLGAQAPILVEDEPEGAG
jgi:hypothetical protein